MNGDLDLDQHVSAHVGREISERVPVARACLRKYLCSTGNLFDEVRDVELFIDFVDKKAEAILRNKKGIILESISDADKVFTEEEAMFLETKKFIDNVKKHVRFKEEPISISEEIELCYQIYWLLRDWY